MENGSSLGGPLVLPGNGPSDNYGNGSYTGATSTPSPADFEDLFGPAGREVKEDPLRHKRHQRWHLPDVLKGTNNFLTDRVDGLISNATDSPFTSSILPYQNVENPDKPLTWEVYSYDEGLASRVPYESAARVLTQSKTSHSAYIVRQGLAISMEHNFMMSERGRRDFNNQLLQLVGSIQYTNDLDVHMALITAPNYERVEAEKYAYSNVDPVVTMRKYVDMFGMCQKNPNGLDILIEDAKQVFKKWGASEPNFMMCNSKIGYQQNMTVEKTQYVTNGIDGFKRLKAGPDLKSYRGLNVINSRHFSMEAGRQPRDLLNRRVRVAEHYKIDAMTPRDMHDRNVMLYDEGKDQMVAIPCETLWNASMIEGDIPFKEVLTLQTDMNSTNPAFWSNPFYKGTGIESKRADGAITFKAWLKADPSETDNGIYHPKFMLRLYKTYYGSGRSTTADYDFDEVNGLTLSLGECTQDDQIPMEDLVVIMTKALKSCKSYTDISGENEAKEKMAMELQLVHWIHFSRTTHKFHHKIPTEYGRCHNSSGIDNQYDLYALMLAMGEKESKYTYDWLNLIYRSKWSDKRPTADEIQGLRGSPDNEYGFDEVAYGVILPYISSIYSQCGKIEKMFDYGFAQECAPKFTLFVVRPSIEHEMLGLLVGRGGTGELGATLWGQTELSCYDDAMHGKWGMNYKYHARAVVFNEKHLIRLWDVAFNGYTGGMGTKIVKWPQTDAHDAAFDSWKRQTMSLDEALRSDFPDIFVMCFPDDDGLNTNMTNPINFYGAQSNSEVHNADPENCCNANMPQLNVFSQFALDANTARYQKYYQHMPNFYEMHRNRKPAGHCAQEGDSSVSCLSYSGTMQLRQKGTNMVCSESSGTGHLGDSYVGSASVRAGHGSLVSGRPSPYRIM